MRNLLASAVLFLTHTGAFATTCGSYEWKEITKVDDNIYKFKVSQVCNLGSVPNTDIEEVNQIVIDQKKDMASEIFIEENQSESYLFSTEETLSLKNGEVDLRSRNYASVINGEISKFKSESRVLQAEGRAKYISSLANEVFSQKISEELMVKVRTTMFLKKPDFVPIDLLKNKVKKDMEEDLSRYSNDLHSSILSYLNI